MNTHEKRAFIMKRYKNATWRRRVHQMKDDQVIAVYLRILQEDQQIKETAEPEQLRLFTYKEQ